jgi:hypothetical protein
MPLESKLEGLIEADPSMLGQALMLIGRQVPTGFGTYIDLLAIDSEGTVHVLELKRDRTPRDVIAQALDYGSWVTGLGHEEVLNLYAAYRPGHVFEQDFADFFGADPPETLNGAHRLTVIAADLDAATERILQYLNAGFGVPVNVVFFRYYTDGDRQYLARTWLLDEADTVTVAGGGKRSGTKEAWNGTDWYVSFGEESTIRNWDDAQRYGFVSAGGGSWFSKTLRGLPLGARVAACIPKLGYVGIGEVIGEAQPFDDAVIILDGAPAQLAQQPLQASYEHKNADPSDDPAEYVVPVKWLATRPREQAVWRKGMFANQNSACKLRNRYTLDVLSEEFGIDT